VVKHQEGIPANSHSSQQGASVLYGGVGEVEPAVKFSAPVCFTFSALKGVD